LAQIKLETYIDRNIAQVRSIFWLTAVVMIAGFALIASGVVMAHNQPGNLEGALISASSGVVVDFIAASFLAVHRSTIAQAKDYVATLERISAVGMAIQIANTVGEAGSDIRQQTTAAVAKQILAMHAVSSGQHDKPSC
jgi:hypothetical protein